MRLLTQRALLVCLAATALLTGCSSGRDNAHVYVPDTKSVPASSSPAPVVTPAPATPAPVVAGAAAVQPVAAPAKATPSAERQRKDVRKVLRKEKAAAARAHKRAAAREALLRQKLRQAREDEAKAKAGQQEALDLAANAKPAKGDASPVTGSDVGQVSQADRDKRSEAEARASVVRFHELLDKHDTAACDLLTPRLLKSIYGEDDPAAKCAAGVAAITGRVSVQILRSAASGRHALLDTITYYGDQSVHQGLALVLVDGTWLIDVVQRQDAPQSAG